MTTNRDNWQPSHNLSPSAQARMPTIERMLSEGFTWTEIGRAVGWDAETARDNWLLRDEVAP